MIAFPFSGDAEGSVHDWILTMQDDADRELLDTLDYLDLNTPETISKLLNVLELDSGIGRRHLSRKALRHHVGSLTTLCQARQSGAIPADRVEQYELIFARLKPMKARFRSCRIKLPDGVADALDQ